MQSQASSAWARTAATALWSEGPQVASAAWARRGVPTKSTARLRRVTKRGMVMYVLLAHGGRRRSVALHLATDSIAGEFG